MKHVIYLTSVKSNRQLTYSLATSQFQELKMNDVLVSVEGKNLFKIKDEVRQTFENVDEHVMWKCLGYKSGRINKKIIWNLFEHPNNDIYINRTPRSRTKK